MRVSHVAPCYIEFFSEITSTEWEFVQTLAYKEQTPNDAEFIRMMYTSRLRKYKHANEHALARRKLVEDYALGDNPDVLYSFADALYAQFRWADCFTVTNRCVETPVAHSASPYTPVTEYWASLRYMLQPCHYISPAFTICHIYIPNYLSSRMKWWTENLNRRSAGTQLGCGT